jgi:DNA-binding GntR family transcriptional regulator
MTKTTRRKVPAGGAADRAHASTLARPDTSTESATDRVTDAITNGIRAGIFVPGQHLLESDLTRRLRISRGSLREALKHLAAAGIVTLNRFRGAYISTLDRKSVLDLLDTLEPLARLAARLAAENCTTAERRQRMKEVATGIELAGRSHSHFRYLEQRRRFYDTLIDIAGNRELARVMPLSRTDLFRAQVETVQSQRQRDRHAGGYAKITKAILSRDPAGADRAVRQHFAGSRRTMKELPSHAFADDGDN